MVCLVHTHYRLIGGNFYETRSQFNKKTKIYIASFRLNPDNWMISKKQSDSWLIIHRETGRTRTIPAP